MADKSLIVVPSGALSSLPLQVLVTGKPPTTSSEPNYRNTKWLGLQHTITIVPSVAALTALRQPQPTVTSIRRPYLGIGNPLLNGQQSQPGDAQRAELARRRRDCLTTGAPTRMASGRSMLGLRSVLRGETADLDAIRAAPPLPETADEICAVGQVLGAQPNDILIGARANERALAALNASGALRSYRIIHFATHGLLPVKSAAIAQIAAEPALLLTPPDTASEEDDGLLTASEITRFDLAADWVILSACNTAAGDATDAETLSGLARAFFYAGARAMLVSHWPVNSAAAVKLVTRTLEAMASHHSIGRAVALRLAITSMIETGSEQESHPSYWAPFVVVGDGRVDSMAPAVVPTVVPHGPRTRPTRNPKTQWRRRGRRSYGGASRSLSRRPVRVLVMTARRVVSWSAANELEAAHTAAPREATRPFACRWAMR